MADSPGSGFELKEGAQALHGRAGYGVLESDACFVGRKGGRDASVPDPADLTGEKYPVSFSKERAWVGNSDSQRFSRGEGKLRPKEKSSATVVVDKTGDKYVFLLVGVFDPRQNLETREDAALGKACRAVFQVRSPEVGRGMSKHAFSKVVLIFR